MFPFSSKNQNEAILVLNIQSTLVKSFLILESQNEKSPIYSHESGIHWKKGSDSGYLVKAALKAVEEEITLALRHIHYRAKNEPEIPEKLSCVHFVLSSPWIMSRAQSARFHFPKKEKITPALVSRLIEQERTRAGVGSLELGPDPAGEKSGDLEVIEQKVFDVKFNGYSIPEWKKGESQDVEISFALSMAGKKMADKLMHLASRAVNKKQVFFHSSILLKYAALNEHSSCGGNCALVDIHGESTDVAFINENICSFIGLYPLGLNGVIRRIAHSAKMEMHAADSAMSLYSAGHLDDGSSLRQVSSISQASTAWIESFKKCISVAGVHDPSWIILSSTRHPDFFARALELAFPKSRIELFSGEEYETAAIHSMRLE